MKISMSSRSRRRPRRVHVLAPGTMPRSWTRLISRAGPRATPHGRRAAGVVALGLDAHQPIEAMETTLAMGQLGLEPRRTDHQGEHHQAADDEQVDGPPAALDDPQWGALGQVARRDRGGAPHQRARRVVADVLDEGHGRRLAVGHTPAGGDPLDDTQPGARCPPIACCSAAEGRFRNPAHDPDRLHRVARAGQLGRARAPASGRLAGTDPQRRGPRRSGGPAPRRSALRDGALDGGVQGHGEGVEFVVDLHADGLKGPLRRVTPGAPGWGGNRRHDHFGRPATWS